MRVNCTFFLDYAKIFQVVKYTIASAFFKNIAVSLQQNNLYPAKHTMEKCLVLH